MKIRWLIILSILAVVFAGAGFYLGTGPVWTHETYYDYYNQGVMARSPEEAINSFTHVANNSKDPWLKSLALSQTGTLIGRSAFNEEFSAESRYQIARYAITVLEEAVVNYPDNGEAKYNLELLRNKLPRLAQQMQEENSNGSGKESGPDPGYSQSNEGRGY